MNATSPTYDVTSTDGEKRLERWRLILGKDAEEETRELSERAARMDAVLESLYGGGSDSKSSPSRKDAGKRSGSLANSQPALKRWLGDVKEYFPQSVVQIMQRDAFDRLGVKALLADPGVLETLEPDVQLAATIVSLSNAIPDETKETARRVVKKLVDSVMKRLEVKTKTALRGSLNRAARTNRPRSGELDFHRTIMRNLRNWNDDKKALIADRLVGYQRRQRALQDVVLCVDESGSMDRSVVYASIMGAIVASLPALATRFVLFDTSVVDLTDKLSDPVDLLFGAQLGGGTDINAAVAYCQTKISRPAKTTFVLITDLYEGGNAKELLARVESLVSAGVNFICLTALDDEGAPASDRSMGAKFAALGVPTFACTPDLFPELLAVALNRQDVAHWAGKNHIQLTKPQ